MRQPTLADLEGLLLSLQRQHSNATEKANILPEGNPVRRARYVGQAIAFAGIEAYVQTLIEKLRTET